ncbi:30S ribosomal protein S9 [candidate division WOR-1 bacterium RIFOXYB2_FULL_48_7]|uniref:Small ribosomal subunit protein uS9 n=1 Tax=candidate division WOR-1 bacterium RIFOXYB2_FULL_48_7 TaxID=1802583 RepID=A0A1F4TS27_UNCSA|nr:MAG: 30S ribosomal protein S9 [candidate division WOR-1 bacterium RIFOXYB2_FULL_48_7]
MIPGNGQVIINGKPYVEYFCHRQSALSPIAKTFSATKTEGKYDVIATCSGGGVTAQATAVSMGIARAMVRLSEDLKTFLRREGLLTRDPRMKERKKYGLKRARRAFQFTKR